VNATTTRKPKQRKIGIVERHGSHALLEIVESNSKSSRAEYYLCDELKADWGTAAYRLEKIDGTVYDVLLDDNTGHHTCDCPGHVQHGHRTRCKHVAGLLALRQAGQLPVCKPKPAGGLVELGRDDEPEIMFIHPTACGCRSCEEHQVLCLDPYDDAA